jgi:hypothetical protein
MSSIISKDRINDLRISVYGTAIKLFKTLFVSLLFLFATAFSNSNIGQIRFSDDFENDLTGWEIIGEHAIKIIDSNDEIHGNVLEMQPDGIVYALIKDSEKWGSVQIEGEVLFPTKGHNYLGLIYNFSQNDSRYDFGEIYLKGNGSYLRANPVRDGNVSRLLYEEYKTLLSGTEKIIQNKWYQFKAEIEKNICHFYIGDMSYPKLTFDHYEGASGLIGLKPRVAGSPVWIDNISVKSIDRLNYNGPNIPMIIYQPDSLITDWEIIGPLRKPSTSVEWSSDIMKSEIVTKDSIYRWLPFETDDRGAVITGKVTEYMGERNVAYFRTMIESESEKKAILHFSTTDEIALWINNRFHGFIFRDGYRFSENDLFAWYDFWKNPEHTGSRIPVKLNSGENQIVIRVRNGQYASNGFFLRLESN